MSAKIEYELLAIDLDGTLVGESPEISQRSVDALGEAARLGVKVTLATGRMYRATKPYSDELGITTPLICYQGAQVRHPTTGEIISETTVERGVALEVLRYCEDNGYHVTAFFGDELFMAELTPEGRYYSERANVTPQIVGGLSKWLKTDVLKLVIVTDEPTTETIVRDLSAQFDGRLYVTRSFPIFAETINPNVSKGKALRSLAGWLGVPMSKVMAIGDDLNDIDMVEVAGLGVVLKNSPPEVLEKASFVTGSVEEDGVASAVEKFILMSG